MSGKSCRVCADERDVFAQMRSKLMSSAMKSSNPSKPSSNQLPCPPDASRLGRATWTFLHSMAAYYPDQPSQTIKQDAHNVLSALPSLYPCEYCRDHLKEYYQQHPIDQATNSRSSLSMYLCRVHNDVRTRQGKREFDCSRLFDRWGGHDWEDKGDCDEREFGDADDELNE